MPVRHKRTLLISSDQEEYRRLETFFRQQPQLADWELRQSIDLEELQTELIGATSKTSYAAIFLDLTEEASCRLEFLKRLTARFFHLNMVVLLPRNAPELAFRSSQAGAQDFLPKGYFDADSLVNLLYMSVERTQQNQQWEALNQLASTGRWEYDVDEKVLKVSPYLAKAYGQDPEKHWYDFEELDPDNWPRKVLKKMIPESLEAGSSEAELQIENDEGKLLTIHLESRLQLLPDGSRKLMGLLQDVTRLRQTEVELARSRERYEYIFQFSRDAVILCHLEGEVVDYNAATVPLFGEVQNDNCIQQAIVPEEDRVVFRQALEAEDKVQDMNTRILTPSGQEKEVVIALTPLLLQSFSGFLCLVRDVTQEKKVLELEQERQLEQRSTQLKERFIASVSHEMRTPMNAITGIAHLLENTGLDPAQRQYVKDLSESARMLNQIVQDLLEVSALQQGQITMLNEGFDLYDLISYVERIHQIKAEDVGLDLTVQIDAEVPARVQGDKGRLSQILFNLLGNAIKFTEQGSVKLHVSVDKKRTSRDELVFVITDTGPGIPEEYQPYLFKPFTRIPGKTGTKGTGLGLAIVKRLTDLYGGRIELESEVGVGTRIQLELPLQEASRAEADYPGQEGGKEAGAYRFLIAEDHPLNRMVLVNFLKNWYPEAQVEEARDGQQALERMEEDPTFDLVLLDLQMPELDGIEVLSRIRDHIAPQVRALKVILLTAHMGEQLLKPLTSLEVQDVLYKPIDPVTLRKKIESIIRTTASL